jgi:superfamily II DNA or RNA helicase
MIDAEILDFENEVLDFAETLDFDDAPLAHRIAPANSLFKLREYQDECLDAIAEDFKQYGRLLAVLATGCGKTVIFSQAAKREAAAGGRVLILAHTEELLDQAADKLERTTGLQSDREKAAEHASLEAQVVIASVQTLTRPNRLTAFPDNHFSLVIVDEAHRTLAASYLRILNYFHFGAASLTPDWKAPEPGIPYKALAKVLGVTATADRGDKRSLGEFYQHCAFDYGLLQACRDGYLVRPVSVQIPLEIDLRSVKVSRTANGSDFDVSELSQRITPFLKSIAKAILEHARDRKTVCFLPGIETARLLSEAVQAEGMPASFVSGACPDRAEKLEAFNAAGPGSLIANAMLLTEGWDCPDVSCVCVLRPTKIRALFTQMVGRGTRTLPGTIDGLSAKEARLLAIKRSAKPDLLILDFLWLSDRLELVRPIDLVATTAQQREAMSKRKADGQVDLLDMAEAASRDLLKSLEAAAAKNAKKKARVIDPLAWAVSLGDQELASWEPETQWDELPPTKGQLDQLARFGIDTGAVKYRGLATKILDRVFNRTRMGLCTPKQLSFMERLGIKDGALLTIDEATRAIDETIKRKKHS